MKNKQDMDTYLKPEEVADILRVSPRSIYGWLKSGRLEAYRPCGRWLITPEQVDRFVKGAPPVSKPGPDVVTTATRRGRGQTFSLTPPEGPELSGMEIMALIDSQISEKAAAVPSVPSAPGPLANRKSKVRK